MGPFQSIHDVYDMLRRRAVLIAVVSIVGTVAALFVALSQQHMYRSAEVIQIAQPQIADELAKSTVDGSSARRLQLIEQRLMARSNVLDVIEKYGLFKDVGDQRPNHLAFLLRSSVRIEGVAAAREGYSDDGTISILTVSAEMPTALQAQQIAHEFAQRTIELSQQARIDQAKATLTFVARQEGALFQELAALEEEISEFRKANNASSSTNVELRAGEVQTLNEGLLDIAREVIEIQRAADMATKTERPATAKRLLAEYEERLATLAEQRDLMRDRKEALEKVLQTSPQVQSQLESFERQAEQLRDQLGAMRSRRTEAEIGFRLETARQSERLMVLEPANLPEYPFTGSRKMLALAGMMASILAGLGLAVLLEFRDPVLRTAHRMEQKTGLKPVVTIPVINKGTGSRGLLSRLFGRRPRGPA
ncbi:DUF874 domain-containing protein [Aliisedimentitalea scapharcae]|uniref:DUF874 domain-containing protein n=1 Tax=Aliisedimentitalea scapharcae TaxID=1524259 RepID=A0ABZ2XX88_9RHOB|nr:DUF874 domain-containing protein [Rhodobacteraceae bacterium M382]